MDFDDYVEIYALNIRNSEINKTGLEQQLVGYLKKRYKTIAVNASEDRKQFYIDHDFKRLNEASNTDIYVYTQYAQLNCPHSDGCGLEKNSTKIKQRCKNFDGMYT